MDGEDNTNPLYVEHIQVPEGVLPPLRRFKTVGPGYFETMGNRIVAGRAIELVGKLPKDAYGYILRTPSLTK